MAFAVTLLFSFVLSNGITRNINGVLIDEDVSRVLLNKHNELRSQTAKGNTQNQPSSTYMNKLKWDWALAAAAQKHSETCPNGVLHSHNREQTINNYYNSYKSWEWDTNQYGLAFQSVGENVDWQPLQGKPVTGNLLANLVERDWFDEYKDYTFNTDYCYGQCGHYTQMVWADTRYVGCGYTDCGNDYVHLVCQYYPSGNYYNRYSSIGYGTQPYYAGNTCSECNIYAKDRGNSCVDGLCDGCMSKIWDMCNNYWTNCDDLNCPSTQCTLNSDDLICKACRNKCNTCSDNDLASPNTCSINGIDDGTNNPTKMATNTPTTTPAKMATNTPTTTPAKMATNTPTTTPAKMATNTPTTTPAKMATNTPTTTPTKYPSISPTITTKPLSSYNDPECEFGIYDVNDADNIINDGWVLMTGIDYNNNIIYSLLVNQYNNNNGINCLHTYHYNDCCVSTAKRLFLYRNNEYLVIANKSQNCVGGCFIGKKLLLGNYFDTLHMTLSNNDSYIEYIDSGCGGPYDYTHPAIFAKCIEKNDKTTNKPITTDMNNDITTTTEMKLNTTAYKPVTTDINNDVTTTIVMKLNTTTNFFATQLSGAKKTLVWKYLFFILICSMVMYIM